MAKDASCSRPGPVDVILRDGEGPSLQSRDEAVELRNLNVHVGEGHLFLYGQCLGEVDGRHKNLSVGTLDFCCLQCRLHLLDRCPLVPLGSVIDAKRKDHALHMFSYRNPREKLGQMLPSGPREADDLQIWVVKGRKPGHVGVTQNYIFFI